MSTFVPVDDINMMNRPVFFTAGICAIGIISGILAGCAAQQPGIVESEPPAWSSVESVGVIAPKEDVWTLLARGDENQARSYFMGQVDVNDTDPQGRTPLHIAAEKMAPDLAAFFISLGANTEALDQEHRTPLAISAEKLDIPTARVLVQAGANIHHPMNISSSPAHIAVRRDKEFLPAMLYPAALSSTDSSGRTMLHIAAEAGNPAAVTALLRAGSSLSKRDAAGKTALDVAFERKDSRDHAETAEQLILAGAVSDNPLYAYFAPAVRSSNYNIRSADGMAPLHYVCREGYMGYLAFMLEKRADVNIKNASGATPLHEAARSGNVLLMETLLDRGAEINTQDAKGNSVLHIAIPAAAHLEAINVFLSRGANPNLRDEHGDSPLHVVIILNRNESIVRALLEAGSDVTIRDIDGKTPLYLAVEKGRNNLIPLLLSYKSDIFASDNSGITPYEKALRENTVPALSMITDETVFQNDSAGNTMLHITVAAGGSPAILNNILDRGASINARNKAGDTSLTIAVRLNDAAAGNMLLGRGADIFATNARGESPLSLTFPPSAGSISELRQWMLTPRTLSARDGLGNTALHYAAQWRLNAWIPFLIQQGADTEAANATGETPLFTAVKYDSPSTVNVLVNNGAVLSGRDTLGNSALHAAVRWHAVNSAGTLIDLGLDVNCHALNGKTPLHDSIRLGMQDMQALLLWYGADIESRDADGNTPFMEAVFAGKTEIMEQLAAKGADPNTRNFRGDTALHIAAAMERPDIAARLLEWGASIHAKNARGRTPLQDAVITSPAMVRTLLTRDRVSSSDDNGSSPLHIAVQERSSKDVIHTILELGARISSVDAEGRTPLRLAVDLGLWETSKVLADSGANVFIAARDGRTAADISLVKGEEAVRALFSGRAIHTKDSSENTILHYAARLGNTATISLLLSLGAQKGVKNISAESPADIALRWNHRGAAAMLN